jgi:hypothetical protein
MSRPRITQIAACCGVNFKRWRFADADWPGTNHETCFRCNAPLDYHTKAKRQRVESRELRVVVAPTAPPKLSAVEAAYRAFRDTITIPPSEPMFSVGRGNV